MLKSDKGNALLQHLGKLGRKRKEIGLPVPEDQPVPSQRYAMITPSGAGGNIRKRKNATREPSPTRIKSEDISDELPGSDPDDSYGESRQKKRARASNSRMKKLKSIKPESGAENSENEVESEDEMIVENKEVIYQHIGAEDQNGWVKDGNENGNTLVLEPPNNENVGDCKMPSQATEIVDMESESESQKSTSKVRRSKLVVLRVGKEALAQSEVALTPVAPIAASMGGLPAFQYPAISAEDTGLGVDDEHYYTNPTSVQGHAAHAYHNVHGAQHGLHDGMPQVPFPDSEAVHLPYALLPHPQHTHIGYSHGMQANLFGSVQDNTQHNNPFHGENVEASPDIFGDPFTAGFPGVNPFEEIPDFLLH